MKMRYLLYSLLIIAVAGLIVYRALANKEANAPEMNQGGPGAAARVTGQILTPRQFEDNLALSGSLEANEQIDIRSEVSGVVESINFQEGSKVAKGQILLQVNDVELRAQLSKAGTARQLAAENERRAKLLLEKQAISQEEYEISSADFKSANAESELISAQLSKTTIRAPFSGTIGLRSISTGTYVTPTTTIAQLVNTSQLKLTVSIPEKYASRMKVNNSLTFTTSDSKDEYTAKIYAIEPAVEVASRTLRMRAITENPEGKLYPGTFANVNLPLEMITDALLVPTEALIPIQNGKKIFVSKNGLAREVVVETGARNDSTVRIISGLHAGDTILTSGVMTLRNGTPLRIIL